MSGFATILLLTIANVFMTFAWYGHLKASTYPEWRSLPLFTIILISWGIALFEYIFQIPANKYGFIGNGGAFSLVQLKVIQEVITIVVFTVFVLIFFKNEVLAWNNIIAFCLLIGAVYFTFK